MKFKKLYFLVIIFVFGSCEKILHEEETQYIVLDSYQEITDVLNGIYLCIRKVHNNNYYNLLCRSDDINYYRTYNFANCSHANSSTVNYQDICGNIYKQLYTAIIGTNSLICQSGEDTDSLILGESYFLRAYCYFKLARFFGQPPLVKDNNVKYDLPKPTYMEVYEFIESDLLKAIELLPEDAARVRVAKETPHQGTAKAMLAEVYLFMAGYPVNDTSKYVKAVTLASDVINNASLYHFQLLSDFADLWKVKYRHNDENIFGIFFIKIPSSGNFLDRLMDVNYEKGNIYGNYYVSPNFFSYNNCRISSYYKPDFKFYSKFPNNYRKYSSMTTGYYQQYEINNSDTSYTLLKYYLVNPEDDPCSYVQTVVPVKWIDSDELKGNSENIQIYNSKNTLYFLRYAQTLLTFAESKARIGQLDDKAYNAINMIRRRANHVDINKPSKFDLVENLTPDQFIDSVLWERAWELFVEPDGRWFDLIRLNIKDQIDSLRLKGDITCDVPEEYLTNDWYFYKIPQEDRWINPLLEEETNN